MFKLKFLWIPILALTVLFFQARPAFAKVDLWPFNDLWNNVKCVTDINCTVRAASTGAVNYISYSIVGEELYNEVSQADIEEMIAGRWNKGLSAAVGNIGAIAYTSPPTGGLANYLRTELSDNILNSTVEAQTVSYEFLRPVSNIWSAMRDLAYGLFLLVMLVIGFMIMLQRQISPRVVVTVSNALPKIILGLVLITFSFPLIAAAVEAVAVYGTQVVWELLGNLASTVTGPAVVEGGVAEAVSNFLVVVTGLTLDAASPLGGDLSVLLVIVFMLLGTVVLFVLTIYRLFSAYVWILLHTIFSPIIFLMGSLPGQEGTIVDFGKKLLAKTLVFPVMLFMFILALYFAGRTLLPTTTSIITGAGFGETLENVIFFRSFLGPTLTLFMLGAAFKAPSFIDGALGLDRPRKR